MAHNSRSKQPSKKYNWHNPAAGISCDFWGIDDILYIAPQKLEVPPDKVAHGSTNGRSVAVRGPNILTHIGWGYYRLTNPIPLKDLYVK